jgi:soluble lytic murein transglycosylase
MFSKTRAAAVALLALLAIPETTAYTAPAQAAAPLSLPAAFRLSDADRKLYRDAFAAVARNDYASAATYTTRAADKTLEPAVTWHRLRFAPSVTFSEITAFLTAYPTFPQQDILQQRAERAMSANDSLATVQTWFATHAPLTTEGKLTFLDLTQFSGDTAKAAAITQDIWRTASLSATQEPPFLRTYGHYLRVEDHQARMNMLLWTAQYQALARIEKFLSPTSKALSAARKAYQVSSRDVAKRLNAVPASLQNDPGLLFDRSKWLRRKGDHIGARSLLLQVPPHQDFADKWWIERDYQIREAIEEKRFQEAYALAARHEQKEGEFLAEAEFLAGWVAVRHLAKPDLAEKHFQTFYNSVSTPVSKAKASYWLAHTLQTLGQKEKAAALFKEAAAFSVTFYGQMASQQIGAQPLVPEQVWPTQEEFAAFHQDPLVLISLQLGAIDQQQRIPPFLQAYAERATSPGMLTLVTNLAKSVGRTDIGLRIAKQAKNRGILLTGAEFPLIPLPSAVQTPETALIHAIIRQESEFAHWVRSPVGASGLMQLMPATAKMEASSLGLAYTPTKLTTDPQYNMRLGANHLSRNLERFDGSYPLTIAAYNAGGGNVQRWLENYGDPRQNQISYIDWMEMIPFRETRNYVQRVLEGLEVYRVRLAQQSVNPGQVERHAWCTMTCGLVPNVRQRNYMMAAAGR